MLVLANETVGATELLDELRAIDAEGKAEYFVCVPANPVDTGQAEHTGAVWVWEETVEGRAGRGWTRPWRPCAAHGLHAEGELGDHRPMVALSAAVSEFKPDRIVISTHPEVHSAWLRQDVVDRARTNLPGDPGPAHRRARHRGARRAEVGAAAPLAYRGGMKSGRSAC